jgi:hypothetical protein
LNEIANPTHTEHYPNAGFISREKFGVFLELRFPQIYSPPASLEIAENAEKAAQRFGWNGIDGIL